MNQLLDKFKAKDKFFMRISIGMQIFCWILIPLYFWMLVINPDPEILLNHRIGGFLYVISFAIFALIFNRKMKDFKEVDYSLPTVIMLEKAADRYKLCKPVLLAALIPIVLVDAGLILFSMDEWTMDDFVLHANSGIFHSADYCFIFDRDRNLVLKTKATARPCIAIAKRVKGFVKSFNSFVFRLKLI